MKFFRRLFFGRELADVLGDQKIVKVHGIRFTIRKVDPTSFLDGSKVMLQEFDIYKLAQNPDKAPEVTQKTLERLREHYSHIFMSGVVSPVLARKKEDAKDGAIFVEYLFTEWDLAHDLYCEIVGFTYGKKKFSHSTSRAISS